MTIFLIMYGQAGKYVVYSSVNGHIIYVNERHSFTLQVMAEDIVTF